MAYALTPYNDEPAATAQSAVATTAITTLATTPTARTSSAFTDFSASVDSTDSAVVVASVVAHGLTGRWRRELHDGRDSAQLNSPGAEIEPTPGTNCERPPLTTSIS